MVDRLHPRVEIVLRLLWVDFPARAPCLPRHLAQVVIVVSPPIIDQVPDSCHPPTAAHADYPAPKPYALIHPPDSDDIADDHTLSAALAANAVVALVDLESRFTPAPVVAIVAPAVRVLAIVATPLLPAALARSPALVAVVPLASLAPPVAFSRVDTALLQTNQT